MSNKSSLNKELVKEFMRHVMKELKLDSLPNIKLSNKSEDAVSRKSWGGYSTGDQSIEIVIAKRHPADIFRYPVLRAYYGDSNYNTEKELSKILDKNPDYIIILEIWQNSLPNSVKNRISLNYSLVEFINEEEKNKLKKINKDYLSTITLYKLINR